MQAITNNEMQAMFKMGSYFLEVNRTPSWNWMSRHVGEDVARGIAEELVAACHAK